MTKQVFVGNLSWNATEQDLEALFSGCGGIERIKIVTDRETGKARGFGFVTFMTEDGKRAAIAMSGQEFQGRALNINEATEKQGGGRRGSSW